MQIFRGILTELLNSDYTRRNCISVLKHNSHQVMRMNAAIKHFQLALEIFSQTRTIQVMAVEGFFEQKYIDSQTVVARIQLKVHSQLIILIFNALKNKWTTYSLSWFNPSSSLLAMAVSTSSGSFLSRSVPILSTMEYLLDRRSTCNISHFIILISNLLFSVGLTIEFCAFALAFIAPTFPEFARANAAARILYSFYDLPEHIDIGEDEKELTGALQVCSLSFAYPSRSNQKVTNDLSISAKAGDSIALVGPSGLFPVITK